VNLEKSDVPYVLQVLVDGSHSYTYELDLRELLVGNFRRVVDLSVSAM